MRPPLSALAAALVLLGSGGCGGGDGEPSTQCKAETENAARAAVVAAAYEEGDRHAGRGGRFLPR